MTPQTNSEILRVNSDGRVMLREGNEYIDTGVRMPLPLSEGQQFMYAVMYALAKELALRRGQQLRTFQEWWDANGRDSFEPGTHDYDTAFTLARQAWFAAASAYNRDS